MISYGLVFQVVGGDHVQRRPIAAIVAHRLRNVIRRATTLIAGIFYQRDMSEQQVISRIAPTPSGSLHLGNALNFLITWEYVRHHRGRLLLRIDDGDATRSRPQFIEDIFRTLEWLGIDWDDGPGGPGDFHARFSQTAKKEHYFSVIRGLQRAYNCDCSRKLICKTFGSPIYGGSCREKQQSFRRKQTAIRLIVDRSIEEGGASHDLASLMGDFVLWTRDDTPAYQLVSLVEDVSWGITHIFRGEDLYTSTLAQKYLARELGYTGFLGAMFHHHPLLYGPDGSKLAKSAGASSLKVIRESGRHADFILRRLDPYLHTLRQRLRL